MAKFLKILAAIVVAVTALATSFFGLLDRRPYQQMPYYQEWLQIADGINFEVPYDSSDLEIGWDTTLLNPQYVQPLAGYGKRKGHWYDSIHDDLYIRSIVLRKGKQKVALVTLDMLIVPPGVLKEMAKLSKLNLYEMPQIYFSATHTHNSFGGWYNSLGGKLFAGEYSAELPHEIASKILRSLVAAEQNFQKGHLIFRKDIDKNHIKNRIDEKLGIYPDINSIVFKRQIDSAILVSYSAHATVLDAKTMQISRDYPGVVVDSLEASGYQFASFMAGAVGSMGPIQVGKDDFDEVKNQGKGVFEEVMSVDEAHFKVKDIQLQSHEIEIPLRSPSMRIYKEVILRPWLFYWLFGKERNYLKVAKLGNILMVGTPCDFSGELAAPLEKYARERGLQLMITSFNGAYMGYVTDDKHYDRQTYESQTMGWFGPYNGAYFSEVIKTIIDKAAKPLSK